MAIAASATRVSAEGSISTAAVSKAAGDLARALNAVETGFVDAATAAILKATKAIAAAETVERKAVANADVVLAQGLQSAWGTYAAAECGAVVHNARERATIGADYKQDVAGAELAAVKAVAPARKTSMVAAAEANGVYHVKVTGVIADLGILGGEIHVEQVEASQSLISPTTLKKWLDSLSSWGDIAAAFAKGLAQGVANLGNAAQDVGVGLLNVPAASVNFVTWASEKLFFDVPDHMMIRMPYIPSPDWSKGMVTPESDFDHAVSKTAAGIGISSFSMAWVGRVRGAAAAGRELLAPARGNVSRCYGGPVDTRLINHGYGPSALGTDRLGNCLYCSLATDATWAGRAATALPRTRWYPRTFQDGLRMVESWVGNGKTFGKSSLDSIREAVGRAVGNRGIVVGTRSDGTSHAFNVINRNGAVRFFDGQVNAAITNLHEYTTLHFLPTLF